MTLSTAKWVNIWLLFCSCQLLNAQTADQLLRVYNITNTSALNNISSPLRSNLAYTQNQLYYYDGSQWRSSWATKGNNNIENTDFLGTTDNTDLRFRTNNAQRMVVKSDGKVGVGINNPSGIFEVNSNDGLLAVSNANTNTSSITYPNSLNDNNFFSFSIFQSATANVDFLTPNTTLTRIVLYSDNPLPQNGFDPDNPTGITVSARQTGGSWTVIFTQTYTPASWLSDELVVITQNQFYLRAKNIDLANSTEYDEYRIQLQNTQHNPIHNSRVAEIRLFEDKTSEFIVNTNGNVGINHDNPTQRLHVIGNILASGTITPDYVFENYYDGKSDLNPTYKFQLLSEVEQFIKENKHLPGVPSAQDIEEQGGILVNKATEINLEKIEELYIHLFELIDENERIKKSIKRIEKEVLDLAK